MHVKGSDPAITFNTPPNPGSGAGATKVSPSRPVLSLGSQPRIERGELVELQEVVVHGSPSLSSPQSAEALGSQSILARIPVDGLQEIVRLLGFRHAVHLLLTSRQLKGLIEADPVLKNSLMQIQEAHRQLNWLSENLQTAAGQLSQLEAATVERNIALLSAKGSEDLVRAVFIGPAILTGIAAFASGVMAAVFASHGLPTREHGGPQMEAQYEEAYQHAYESYVIPLHTSLGVMGAFGIGSTFCFACIQSARSALAAANRAHEEARSPQLVKTLEVEGLSAAKARASQETPELVFHFAAQSAGGPEQSPPAGTSSVFTTILRGDVRQVVAGVREVLDAPESLLASGDKVRLLVRWKELFRGGPYSQETYRALSVFLAEILDSHALSAARKNQICLVGVDLTSIWNADDTACGSVLACVAAIRKSGSPDMNRHLDEVHDGLMRMISEDPLFSSIIDSWSQ